ncbi:SubName: Full=Uncharacterized protein {ECO:0000313/EMBL:CCA66411.1} [Serendipita indica DSM 11827]|uniref:Uncharacterized protein n=1 Tax=Serendipita indica (strain DSM 11827) TaxID=1109443 RepID=G4T4S5_SERID|nr:SubName: Full=Uncharacterized protein {ECO:0000313/EMBL:CCA66411.1} [Serendipita indica DSM 11827]CCA66411.1 hypothetical protein PIIN_00097 [Serendipita indica DSM 11827]
MVLLLEEADDPNAKLAIHPGPPVNRISEDDLTELATTDSESGEVVPLIRQDPPPSYSDVRVFQQRLKSEEESYGGQRARRRFCLALGVAFLLFAIPTATIITLKLTLSSRSATEPSESTTTSGSPQPTSDHPNHTPPWREYPGKGPDDHRGGPDHWPPPRGGGGGERRPGGDRGEPHRFPEGEGHGRPEFPPPDPEAQPICADWTSTEISDGEQAIPAFISTFPLSYFSKPIFMRSSLSKAKGHLRVSFVDQLELGQASVHVTASKLSQEELKKIRICVDRGFDGSSILDSLGNLTNTAEFDIALSLSSQQPILPGLVTELPRFAHSFDDSGVSRFRFMSLYGQEGDISFQRVYADSLFVTNVGGSVDGYISTTRRLGIETTSKPISITADLCNDGQDFYPAWARLSSSQASIDAKMVLCERATDRPWQRNGEVGRYDISVANKDAAITLEVKHAAPKQGSSLYINVTNEDTLSLGRTHSVVTLDTGYEGRFLVRAPGSSTPVSVESEEATDDEGGIRYVEKHTLPSQINGIEGKVSWGRFSLPDRPRSDVFVNTVGEGETGLVLLGD